MKLFLYDKFFEKFIELPKNIQSKVLDFQKKFRENSRSAAIHLEPIRSFSDPSLRTARIDDKYRAIIKVPETGDDYFLLWIDTHDEAMAWAENKTITWNKNTQSIQIFTALEVETKAESNTPQSAQQVSIFDFVTDEQLLAIGVPPVVLPLVKKIRNLNDLETIEKNLPVDAFENLFYLADGADIDRLLGEIEEGKVASKAYQDQLESINNQRSFIKVEDDLLAEMIQGDLKKWQLFLHPTQRKLVEGRYNGPLKVTGGGGTGKTVAAIHRLKFLSTDSIVTLATPILFTTYTSALSTNLASLIGAMGISPTQYHLANIDALARDLAVKNGIITKDIRFLDFPNTKSSLELWDEVLELTLSQFDATFLHTEYQEVILYNAIVSEDQYYSQSRIGRGKGITRKQRMDVWNAVQAYQKSKEQGKFIDRAELFNLLADHFNQAKTKPFSFAIVDEIQDFSNVELRFIRSLVEEKVNDLFLVGDPYQRIYYRKINFSAVGINVRGTRSKRLRINYRTTEEIKRFAISTVKGFSYDNFDGESEKLDGYLSLFHGDKPVYEVFTTKAGELEHITQFIKECNSKGFINKEIAIACRLKDGLREIKSALHLNNMPYFDLTSQSGKIEGIQLSTFHSLKGLEFKIVILADVNNRTAPYLPYTFEQFEPAHKEDHLLSERALIYVAVTRAMQQVKITGTGSRSEIILI